MREAFDILEYSIRGILMLYLCNHVLSWRKVFKKQGKYLFFLLFVAIETGINYSAVVQKFLYGEEMIIVNSKESILKLFLLLVCYYLLLDIFYQESRLVKCYLVLLYIVIFEMARFSIHGFWSFTIEKMIAYYTEVVLQGQITQELFLLYMQRIEVFGIWILTILYVVIMYFTISAIRQYQKKIVYRVAAKEILYLMITPAIGLVFDIVIRCILLTMEKGEPILLYERHKSMYAVIPLMSFLCLLAIVYSIKIYGELLQAQEEKHSLVFYEKQLRDMNEHVQEMEALYAGIRGMRHDMNNYIADMEQLLKKEEEEKFSQASYYLHCMKKSLEELTFKHQSGNPVTDVILNRKAAECTLKQIVFESDFLYLQELGIEAFDLGILLNNALDNAIEACERCQKQQKKIILHSYRKSNMFFMQIENTCDSAQIIYTEKAGLQTNKEDSLEHGIGLQNMKRIVEHYYGSMTYEIQENSFLLLLMLQGKTAQESFMTETV